jgi:hypothetical protein
LASRACARSVDRIVRPVIAVEFDWSSIALISSTKVIHLAGTFH